MSASRHQTKLSLLPPHLKELEGSLGTVSEVSKAVEVGFAVVPLEHTTLTVKLDAINFISALVGQGNEGLGGIFGDSGWWVELVEQIAVQIVRNFDPVCKQDILMVGAPLERMVVGSTSGSKAVHDSIPGGAIGIPAFGAVSLLGLGELSTQIQIQVLHGDLSGVFTNHGKLSLELFQSLSRQRYVKHRGLQLTVLTCLIGWRLYDRLIWDPSGGDNRRPGVRTLLLGDIG